MIVQLNPPINILTPAGIVEAQLYENLGKGEFCLFHGFNEAGAWVVIQSYEARPIGNLTYDQPYRVLEEVFSKDRLDAWKKVRELKIEKII